MLRGVIKMKWGFYGLMKIVIIRGGEKKTSFLFSRRHAGGTDAAHGDAICSQHAGGRSASGWPSDGDGDLPCYTHTSQPSNAKCPLRIPHSYRRRPFPKNWQQAAPWYGGWVISNVNEFEIREFGSMFFLFFLFFFLSFIAIRPVRQLLAAIGYS